MTKYRVLSTALIAAAALACGAARAQPFAFFTPLQPQPEQAAPQAAPPDAGQDQSDENAQLDPRLQRQVVDYPTREAPGTIIVDTPHTFLYYVLGGGKAMRYGIGVGRKGFTWSGVHPIVRKQEWPDWYPPPEMVARQPYLPRVIAGGPGNPLGARAMYIGGTEYRIHGTNDPSSIGKFMSSGCIRMTNDNAIDLYNRVQIGAKVIVLPMHGAPVEAAAPAWQKQAEAAIAASRQTTNAMQQTPANVMQQTYAPPVTSHARVTWNATRGDGLY